MQWSPSFRGHPYSGILGRWGGTKYNKLNPTAYDGLAAWYDVSDYSSLTVDGSNRVSLVADKSGNSGTNCLCLNGVAGNYASAPDSAALSITGDIDVRAYVAMDDWTPSAQQAFVAKYVGGTNQRSWRLICNTNGTLAFQWSTDGTAGTLIGVNSSVAPTVSDFGRLWIRATLDVDDGAGGYVVTFYTGGSSETPTWVQLGTATTGGSTTSIFDSTVVVSAGAIENGGQQVLAGKIFRAQVYSGIGGTLAFDANFALPAKLATSFTESSSNAATVTINSSGDLGARISGERDLVQLTAAKQPIYLPWSGVNYGWLNGVSGNYFSTPDSAAVDFTTSLEAVFRVSLDDWTPSGAQAIGAKWVSSGNQKSYVFEIFPNGRPNLGFTTDGVTDQNVSANATPPLVDRTTYWIRYTFVGDNGAGGHDVAFYYQADTGSNTPPSSGWTQIGTTVTTAGTRSLHVGTAPLKVGAIQLGTQERLTGNVFYAEFRASVGGAATAIFNPSLYTSGTTFTASTGEVWTLNGGATIVNRTSLYFDGSDDYMKAAAFSLSQPESVYFVGQQVSWTSLDGFYDGNANETGFLLQNDASPDLRISAGATGAGVAENSNFALGVTGIASVVFNGASSALRINRGTAATGNAGTGNMNGFILGARGTPAGYANIRFNEAIIRSAADATATQDRFALYAGGKWGFQV